MVIQRKVRNSSKTIFTDYGQKNVFVLKLLCALEEEKKYPTKKSSFFASC